MEKTPIHIRPPTPPKKTSAVALGMWFKKVIFTKIHHMIYIFRPVSTTYSKKRDPY
jgi:hypothetical protein